MELELAHDETIFHTSKFVEDIPLIMSVELGRADMQIQEILGLKKGSVVPFLKNVGDPMDVVISERLMARGEIVVINERYGVRISEVTRPDEQIGAKQ